MFCSKLSVSRGNEQKLLKSLQFEREGEAGSVAGVSYSVN